LYYIVLHCITLYYIVLHCITLYYIVLQYNNNCITLHYITLYYITGLSMDTASKVSERVRELQREWEWDSVCVWVCASFWLEQWHNMYAYSYMIHISTRTHIRTMKLYGLQPEQMGVCNPVFIMVRWYDCLALHCIALLCIALHWNISLS